MSEVEGGEVLQVGDEVEFVVVTNQRTRKHSACCVRKLWWVLLVSLSPVIICLYLQQRPAPRETHLQAEDNEHWGEGARGGQGGGHQAAQGAWRHQGVPPKKRKGEEPRGGDGPDGATHCALKASREIFVGKFNRWCDTVIIIILLFG